MKLVLSLGGSVVGDHPSAAMLRDLRSSIETLRAQGDEIHVVVGGGPLKSQFGELARAAGLGEYTADRLGVRLTRVYAELISGVLGDLACGYVPESVEEAVRARSGGKTVVMGGTEAGHSTTAVAALLAEAIGASRLLKLSDVDGIYSRNPKRFPDALRFDELTYPELRRILGSLESNAGTYEVLDAVALGVLERSAIETVYFEGVSSMKNILRARSLEIGSYLTAAGPLVELREALESTLHGAGLSFTHATSSERGTIPPLSSRTLLVTLPDFRFSITIRFTESAASAAVGEAQQAAKRNGAEIAVLVARGFSPSALAQGKAAGVKTFTPDQFRQVLGGLPSRPPSLDAGALRAALG